MPSNIGATEHHGFYGHSSAGDTSELATDLSGTSDFTDGSTWIYHSSFSPGTPCTVMLEFRIEWGASPAGYLFSRYSGTTRQGIRYNGTTGLQLLINNAVDRTLNVPGSGSDTVTIHWATADDPLSARSRSQIRVWRSDGSLIVGLDWTHNEPDTAGTDCIFGAQVTGGTNGTGSTLYGAGYLLHDTSPIQVYRDRLSEASAPTLTGETSMEVPVPSSLTVFGQQDSAAGPTHWAAAQSVAASHLLTVGPLVNRQWVAPPALIWGVIGTDPWFTLSPDGVSYLCLGWLWRRPVPRSVSRVIVRAFVRSGRSGTTTENSVTMSAWSFDRQPGIDADPPAYYTASESFGPVNDTNTGTPGRWLEFQPIRIARTSNNRNTWLGLSVRVTGASGSVQNVAVLAVTIEPIAVVDSDAIAEVGLG